MQKSKQEIISFKVDPSLHAALRGMPNRSEFIRAALLAALDSSCPLCKGTGILSPDQKMHWNEFAQDHALEECSKCHELHLVCSSKPRNRSHRTRRSKR